MDGVNKSYLELSERKYKDAFQSMIDHENQLLNVLLYEDWYGDNRILTQLSPYLWLIPFTVTVTISIVFKRAKLLGNTQMYLITIMVLDLLYSLLTGIRDLILHFFDMDYGYIEYKMCRGLLFSFYLQNGLHGTSLWIKCMMSFTHSILIAFPLKFKGWKLKKFVIIFAMLNLAFLAFFFVLPIIMPLKGVWTFKLSERDNRLKVIEACAMDFDTGFYDGVFFAILQKFIIFNMLGYSLAIPTIFDIILICLLTVLMLKHIKLLSSMALSNRRRSRVKYLILMKMNIILGVSFILQEVPICTYIIIILTSDGSQLLQAAGIYNALLTISFVIGKPIDLIIYASLSDCFRSEFCKLFLRGKKLKIFSILRNNTNTGALTKQTTV